MKINAFAKSISIYTISNVINSGAVFLLLPVLTSYLTPQEYGVYSMFLILVTTSFNLIGVSSHGAIQVEYYNLSKKDFAEFVSTSLALNGLIFVFALLVSITFESAIASFLEVPPRLIWCIPLIGFFQIVLQSLLVIFQASNRPLYYGALNSFLVLLNIGLSLLAVAAFNYKWEGVILAMLTAYAAIFIISMLFLIRAELIVRKVRQRYIRQILRFGLPLLPHAFSGLCIEFGNRIFITKMINISEMGIYNVGNQVAKIISLLEVSFVQAYTPFLFENLRKNNPLADRKIVRSSYAFISGLLLCVVALWALTPLIFKYFIGEEFDSAIRFVLIIASGYFFSGVYKMFVGYIFFYKKTVLLGYIALINIVVSVVLNYILISYFKSAIGAAWAALGTYVLLSVMTIIVSSRIRKMPWAIKSVF